MKFTSLISVTALLLVATVCALGQSETGSVSGTVTDSSGAVVSGAQVAVTSIETSATRTSTTSSSGAYSITNLAPALYELRISSQGFGDFKQKFTVSPGGHISLDANLSAKGTETVVEVTAHPETEVDTQSSSISQMVTSTRVAALPSLTRNPYDFVQTMGNVNQDTSSGTGGLNQVTRGAGVSINGQRSASTDALLDGGENVDLYTTKVGQTVPLDSVQEFSVNSNNFSAEYGRASGGVINVVTKSGTNSFHGSGYEYNRVSALTTNDVDSIANGVPKSKYTRNQFGYSFGGPILKNKLFFFSNTEWTRVRSAANIIAAIPSPQLVAASSPAIQSYFSGFSLRPGLTVIGNGGPPADVAGGSTPTYAAYLATGQPVFNLVNYQAPSDSGGGSPENTYNMVHRLDFNLSNKTTMYGRYARFDENDFAGFVVNSPYSGFDTGQIQVNQNFLYSLTHIWSPKVVTDSKINVNRLNLQQPLNPAQAVQPSIYLSYAVERTVSGQPTCLPGYSCTTPGNSIPFGGPQNVFQFAQSVSWNVGKHDLRFGGGYIYTKDNRTFGAYENAVEALEPKGFGTFAGGLENMLNGNMGWFQVVVDPQGKFPCFKDETGAYIQTPDCTINLPTVQPSFTRSNRYNDMSFYGQDSWKFTRRLTLNLGLRWEYYGIQHNADPKLDSNFVYGSGSSLFDKVRNGRVDTVAATANSPASPVGGLWEKRLHNFGPRAGFAWDLFGDGRTSLRGGYGIAYERNFGNVTFNVIQNPPAQFNANFPAAAQPFEPGNLGPFAGTGTKRLNNPSLRYVKQDLPTAYSQSWNLALQREILHGSLFAMEYTGSRGVHLYSIENLNQVGFGVIYEGTDPVVNNSFDRLNRQYGNMNTRGANGFSYYDSLNSRFVSTNLFHQGLDFTVNYTWSHTIDNLSSTFSETPQTENLGLLDPFQPALDKGNADFDARHRVAISAVWTLPYAKNTHGFVRQIFDGWEFAPIVTARTGNSFTVFDSTNNVGDTVAARYIVPAGANIPLTGTTANNTSLGGNTFAYLTLPASPAYIDPLVGSGELPTCNMVTNAAGNLVSTGQNCQWPANMSHRNAFGGPGWYNIDAAIGKTFPIGERFKLQFRSEFYNMLNHSNYFVQSGGSADTSVNDLAPFQVIGKRGFNPAAGIPNERRFIQMSLRLSF
jgi:hypothetical protein